MLQEEISKNIGFNNQHIFYKLIYYGLKSSSANPRNFEWPDSIVEFVNSLEASGGAATVNLLRGPGETEIDTQNGKAYWRKMNIPLPTKRTRQRRKPLSVMKSGMMTSNVINFQRLADKSPAMISNEKLTVTPLCISRDAMAIKPSGDIDPCSNTIIGLTVPIDINYIKANPIPDPDDLKPKMYTEAGALIGTTLDNSCSLLLGNDFLTHSVSGDDVLKTLDNAVSCIQCCQLCMDQIVSETFDKELQSTATASALHVWSKTLYARIVNILIRYTHSFVHVNAV